MGTQTLIQPSGEGRGQERELTAELDAYAVLDGDDIPDLDAIVALAAHLCEVPTAMINVLTPDRQVQIAAVGYEKSVHRREDSLCAVTAVSPGPVMAADARTDPRFAENPFVTGVIDNVRFYAATQLRGRAGHVLGTLCLYDYQPRTLTPAQQTGFGDLATLVIDVLELRRRTRELVRLAAEREQTRQELDRAHEALAKFAGAVAHDLRSPLMTITGTASLLAEDAFDSDADTVVADVNTIARAAERLNLALTDLAVYAGIGTEKLHCPVALPGLMMQIVGELRQEISNAGASVEVGNLPAVESDPNHLRLLVRNLITNSLKFRDPQRACRIAVGGGETPDGWCLQICDNGIGIPAARRAEVLLPCVRLHRDIPGYGLGLAICSQIVRVHHGRIDITDTPGGGTTITISFSALAPAPDSVPPGPNPDRP
ncbi:GAF domain-containing sensor histidine kinase [Actinoplanes sp. NEAU-A12]|uniref:Sensor-like histidine kinase SenX3 n=1 Tax=Actinoplanes sandaracinus TaxID=3045177 RepID=A0ABT6WC98_9ACTN|nr:GAF domain-containing sensor histidine kinase [Actinoplanes sandaracinus]MDI6097369.1 GAF domain-containing sensor histidine kinase [Actinoplanes sandaracinus]